MSGTLQRIEPAYWHCPPGDIRIATEVGEQAAAAGYGPDHDQQQCLNGIFALDIETGKSAAFEAAVIACRRNLKSATFKMAVLGWLFLLHIDPIVWTAHEWDTVEEDCRELDEIIGGYPFLSRQVRTFSRARREMYVVTRGGGRLLFKTRTPGGGRGLDGEKLILDEAWKARDAHLGSLMPMMSARSMTGDPQILVGSSAAWSDSEVLHPLIDRGRAAARSEQAARLERRLFYCEYCAPDPEVACDAGAKCDHALDAVGCGCDKPEMVALANPAVGRRIDMEFVLTAERRSMPPHEYGRERMGWHDKPIGQAKVIPLLAWAAGLDEKSEPAGPYALSVVYTSDKQRAAIGLAALRHDRRWHVELADYLDTSRVVRRVNDILVRANRKGRTCLGIAVDKNAHEAACIKPLEDKRLPVHPMNTNDVTTAFAGFYQAVMKDGGGGALRHRGQDELTVALLGAGTRLVGDAGEAWGRKISGVEIAPVVAVTNARWLYELNAPAVAEAEPGAWVI